MQITRETRIVFVHPGIFGQGPRESVYGHSEDPVYPPWGAMYLAQEARSHGAVPAVVDGCGRSVKDVLAEVLSHQPDVVGVTLKRGLAAERARQMLESLRAAAVATVVGGPLVSEFRDEVFRLFPADLAVVGDGEGAIASILELPARGAPQLVCPPPPDLAGVDLPWLEIDLAPYVLHEAGPHGLGRRSLMMSASRGCTRRCAFCYLNTHATTARLRQIEVGRMASNLQDIQRRFDVSGFYFVDDCLLDRQGTVIDAWERHLTGLDFRFGGDIQLDELCDAGLLSRLHRVGFRSLYCGLESGSLRIRNSLGKASVSNAQIAEGATHAARLGISITFSVGCGWPNETPDDFAETATLLGRLSSVAAFEPFVATQQAGTRVRISRTAASPFSDFSDYAEPLGPIVADRFLELQDACAAVPASR